MVEMDNLPGVKSQSTSTAIYKYVINISNQGRDTVCDKINQIKEEICDKINQNVINLI